MPSAIKLLLTLGSSCAYGISWFDDPVAQYIAANSAVVPKDYPGKDIVGLSGGP